MSAQKRGDEVGWDRGIFKGGILFPQINLQKVIQVLKHLHIFTILQMSSKHTQDIISTIAERMAAYGMQK